MLEPGAYHLVGVAGVGMSALAQVFLAKHCTVSGCDRVADAGARLPVLDKLRAAGVRLHAEDGSGISPSTRGVVVSTAIEDDNPERARARALGIPVLHRAEALAALADGHPTVAVTGASGKSTVTGMTGWILEALGADPFVVNGAPVINWRDERRIGNVRPSADPAGLWLFEADESDRSLLRFRPDWALITNLSRDHFELDETRRLFARFEARVSRGVVNMAAEADALRILAVASTPAGSRFDYGGQTFELRLPGRHNAENALCAVRLCERLGYPLPDIARALRGFAGIERRLERIGAAGGVAVIDDYAHNPAKIRASWQALAERHGRLRAAWRPHGYGPLRTLMDELIEVFSRIVRPDDRLFVLPVYDAGGTADRSVQANRLTDALAVRGCPAALLPGDINTAAARLADDARPGDAVLVMGARDPALPRLARAVLDRLQRSAGLAGTTMPHRK